MTQHISKFQLTIVLIALGGFLSSLYILIDNHTPQYSGASFIVYSCKGGPYACPLKYEVSDNRLFQVENRDFSEEYPKADAELFLYSSEDRSLNPIDIKEAELLEVTQESAEGLVLIIGYFNDSAGAGIDRREFNVHNDRRRLVSRLDVLKELDISSSRHIEIVAWIQE